MGSGQKGFDKIMSNDVKLQEGHPVDENLRPIKVGGKSTALEVSETDVRVNNLYVNGTTTGVSASDATKLPLTGGAMTGAITTNSTFDGIDIATRDAILTSTTTTAGAALPKAGGTMTGDITTDSDIISTNLTINDAGTITLDSNDGNFIAKKAGTEFSAANSAYAGMILGYTTRGIDGAAESYTLTASFVTVDDNLKVKFVAPPSGVVEISVSIYADFARRAVQFGLSDQDTSDTYQAISFPNATDVTNEHFVAAPPSSLGDHDINHSWVVTGLTSGTSYEWWLGAKSIFIGGVLRWGGNAANGYAPFIMKATALPTAVADYAVYG